MSREELESRIAEIDAKLVRFHWPHGAGSLAPDLRARLEKLAASREELVARLDSEPASSVPAREAELAPTPSADFGEIAFPAQAASPDDAEPVPASAETGSGEGKTDGVGPSADPPSEAMRMAGRAADMPGSSVAEFEPPPQGAEKPPEAPLPPAPGQAALDRVLEEYRNLVEIRSAVDRESMPLRVPRERAAHWPDYCRLVERIDRTLAELKALPAGPELLAALDSELSAELKLVESEAASLKEGLLAERAARDRGAERVERAMAEMAEAEGHDARQPEPPAEPAGEAGPEGPADPGGAREPPPLAGLGEVLVPGQAGLADGVETAADSADKASAQAGPAPRGDAMPPRVPQATGNEPAFLDVPVSVGLAASAERCGFLPSPVELSLVDRPGEPVVGDRLFPSGLRVVGPVGFHRLMAFVEPAEVTALRGLVKEIVGQVEGVRFRSGEALPADREEQRRDPLFAELVIESSRAACLMQFFGTGGLDWRYSRAADELVAGETSIPGFLGDGYLAIGRLSARRRRKSKRHHGRWLVATIFYGAGSVDLSELPASANELFRWGRGRVGAGRHVKGDLDPAEKVLFEVAGLLGETVGPEQGPEAAFSPVGPP